MSDANENQDGSESAPVDAVVITRLESWWGSKKGHAVEIGVDTGYGATCWEVTLTSFKGTSSEKRQVVAHETVFIGHDGVDDHWHEEGDTLYVSPKSDEVFPGLEATINCAIDAAEKWL